MNMLDLVIEPGDATHTEIMCAEGPRAADHYMHAYNNACIQYAGFERYFDTLQRLSARPHVAWLNNLSTMEH